jgi:hypothetical protein
VLKSRSFSNITGLGFSQLSLSGVGVEKQVAEEVLSRALDAAVARFHLCETSN